MTDAQRERFYFPAWRDACRKLGWSESKGRLQMPDADKLNATGQRVLAIATEAAQRESRAATLRDLRHACTTAAIGRPKDTNKLGNRELNLVVDLFKLLADETNLGADMRMSRPENYDRDAILAHITRIQIPLAVIADVCQRSFAPNYVHPYYEDLPLPELRGLVGVLEEIASRNAEARNVKPELAPAIDGEIPF